LFADKYKPEIVFTSPVSGEVVEIRRGERRRILEYVVKADTEQEYKQFEHGDPKDMSADKIKQILLDSGLWASIIQRPYGIIADPERKPKAVHISTFDTAPLAPDYQYVFDEDLTDFITGIEVIKKLSGAKVFLNLDANIESNIFEKIEGVQITKFQGKHPAGNVGVQIHHLTPIIKGDVVWTVRPQELAIIGRLFRTGKYDATKIIALVGSEVKEPKYYKVIRGTNISSIVSSQVEGDNKRYISGNVLTGAKVSPDGFLGFYDDMISVIPEGNYYEFMAWAGLGLNKFSTSRTYFSWMFPKKEWVIDTNLHGGKRAIINTGQMSKVLPMEIFPDYLIKAILVEDIEEMEALGIYDIVEEDMALCEFVCVSKMDIQDIVNNGIELMVKELG